MDNQGFLLLSDLGKYFKGQNFSIESEIKEVKFKILIFESSPRSFINSPTLLEKYSKKLSVSKFRQSLNEITFSVGKLNFEGVENQTKGAKWSEQSFKIIPEF